MQGNKVRDNSEAKPKFDEKIAEKYKKTTTSSLSYKVSLHANLHVSSLEIYLFSLSL